MIFREENEHSEQLEEVLEHWEESFEEKEREREGKKREAGVELKFPVVDEKGEAVPLETMIALWEFLGEEGWEVVTDPHFKMPIGATHPGDPADDLAGTETGYCKLELSLGYKENLWALQKRIFSLAGMLEKFRQEKMNGKMYFLCFGIQPMTPPSEKLMMKKQRNLFWNKAFGNTRVHFFTIPATNQVHADVDLEEAAAAVNVFNALSPVQIAMNAHSNIWKGRVDREIKALSQHFWTTWLPGNSRVGMTPRRFANLADYMIFVSGFRPIYVKRDGRYYGIGHYSSFAEYWASDKKAVAEAEDGRMVPMIPRDEDFDLHYTFCWNDARLSGYYTLENRVNCQQPPHRLMIPAALTIGIMEKLLPAQSMVDTFDWDDLMEAREDAIRNGMQATVAEESLREFCHEVLLLAEKGLAKRGLGEETLLQPLWEDFDQSCCPADVAREVFLKEGIEAFLEKYSLSRILD